MTPHDKNLIERCEGELSYLAPQFKHYLTQLLNRFKELAMVDLDEVSKLRQSNNELQQCIYGLNGAIDEYWNARHRGERQIKKIEDWQQTCLRTLNQPTQQLNTEGEG